MSSAIDDRDRESILHDLENADDEVRRLAVERLLVLPLEEAVPRLVVSLGDRSWRVRKAAVDRLVGCGETQAVVAGLIEALADGENPGRRNSAVEALVKLGSTVTSSLIEALDTDDVDVRKFLVDALAGIGDAESRDAMIQTLEDADPNVRAAAADALGVIGGEGIAAHLMARAVLDSEDPLVRLSALRALARIEAPVRAADLGSVLDQGMLRAAGYGVLGFVDDEDSVACLTKGLSSNARAAREAAMEALLRLLSRVDGERSEVLVVEIRSAARASELVVTGAVEHLPEADLATRLVLVQFLGLLDDERAVVPILMAGQDEAIAEVAQATLEAMGSATERGIDAAWSSLDGEIRRDACTILGRVGGAAGRGRLLLVLDDADPELRSAAARALGECRCAEALPTLVGRLEAAAVEDEEENEEEVEALVEALVALGSPVDGGPDLTAQAVELLSARLEGAVEAVRLAIATVLGRIGRPQDAELVSLLLKDASAAVRRAAVEALARLEPGAASEPLRLALADESPMVRIAAAGALGASGNSNVLDDLRRLIHDEDARVRAAAVRAIGVHSSRTDDESAHRDAVALLENALLDEGGVAMAGAEALKAVGGQQAAQAAARLLDRPEAELIQAAVACIGAHGDAATVDELLSLVSHPHWAVRSEVIQTLAERGVARAVPPILRRLETEQDNFVRESILRALKRLEG
ncbi:MAG: HEAT repeat domain-containing protein [Proteobacteria bacterium]|nr:HEAT repeat domain-containing protein [Pseudomonadota bacterium]